MHWPLLRQVAQFRSAQVSHLACEGQTVRAPVRAALRRQVQLRTAMFTLLRAHAHHEAFLFSTVATCLVHQGEAGEALGALVDLASTHCRAKGGGEGGNLASEPGRHWHGLCLLQLPTAANAFRASHHSGVPAQPFTRHAAQVLPCRAKPGLQPEQVWPLGPEHETQFWLGHLRRRGARAEQVRTASGSRSRPCLCFVLQLGAWARLAGTT